MPPRLTWIGGHLPADEDRMGNIRGRPPLPPSENWGQRPDRVDRARGRRTSLRAAARVTSLALVAGLAGDGPDIY